MEIQGSVGSIVARDRDVGFRQEIKKHPNMQICASEVGDFNRITAEKAMENIIINSHNSFNAVFAHSDEDGLGALQALKGAGMDPGKNISIVSVNGVQDVLKAILAGEYLATVENNPKLGYVVFEVIDQMERGTVPPSQIVMPYRIIDYSNAMECMETS